MPWGSMNWDTWALYKGCFRSSIRGKRILTFSSSFYRLKVVGAFSAMNSLDCSLQWSCRFKAIDDDFSFAGGL